MTLKEYKDYEKMDVYDYLNLPFIEDFNPKTVKVGNMYRLSKTAYKGQLSSVETVIGLEKIPQSNIYDPCYVPPTIKIKDENGRIYYIKSFGIEKLHLRKDTFAIEELN